MSRYVRTAWGTAFVLSLLAVEYGCGGATDTPPETGPFGTGNTSGSGGGGGAASGTGSSSGSAGTSSGVGTSGHATSGNGSGSSGGGSGTGSATGSGATSSSGSGSGAAGSGTSPSSGTSQGGTDAGTIDSGAIGGGGGFPAGTPFKGVAFAESGGASCSDLTKLNLSWFYNWGGSTACKSPPFVPQVWGNWNKISWVANPQKVAAAGFNIVLGFNEPDNSTQSNMTVAQAIQLWPQVALPAFQRVGSPATSSSPTGQTWTQQFMAAAKQQSLRVDFVAIHWYGWTPGSCADVKGLDAYITWAEQWGKPVWITEFSCRLQTAAVTKAFYDAALVMFKNHALLERYAWFETRSTGVFAGATLIDPAGNLTPLGQDYAAAPAVH